MKTSMQRKLDQLSTRLAELNDLLSRENVTADLDQYRKLTREHAELGPVAEVREEPRQLDPGESERGEPEHPESGKDAGHAGLAGCSARLKFAHMRRMFSARVTGSRWFGLTQQRVRHRWSISRPFGIGPTRSSYTAR